MRSTFICNIDKPIFFVNFYKATIIHQHEVYIYALFFIFLLSSKPDKNLLKQKEAWYYYMFFNCNFVWCSELFCFALHFLLDVRRESRTVSMLIKSVFLSTVILIRLKIVCFCWCINSSSIFFLSLQILYHFCSSIYTRYNLSH